MSSVGRQLLGGSVHIHLSQQQLPPQQQYSVPRYTYKLVGYGQIPSKSEGPEIKSPEPEAKKI